MTPVAYASVGPDTRDTWETPEGLFGPLDAIFGFTLDAAADETNAKCERFLTGPCKAPEWCMCGLCASWLNDVVFCNPPYGRENAAWIRKCAEARHEGATVVLLLPNGTDTEWFADIWNTASEIWFLSGRVQFKGTTSSNPKGSIIAIFRPMPAGFFTESPAVRLWNWRDAS